MRVYKAMRLMITIYVCWLFNTRFLQTIKWFFTFCHSYSLFDQFLMTFSTFWMQVNWNVWHLWRCLLHVNINTISRWKVCCVMTAFLRNSNRIQHENQPPFWGIFRSFEVVGVCVCGTQFSFNLTLKICMLTLMPDIEQSGHFSNVCLLFYWKRERKRQKTVYR